MIKNIIKRVIVGVAVALILSFIYSKVNAEEIGSLINVNIHSSFTNEITFNPVGQTNNQNVSWETPIPQTPPLKNSGKGFIIFSFAYYSSGNYAAIVEGVSIKSGSELFACDIGNLEPYTDSKVQYKQASAKCYVNIGASGWERIRFTIPYLPGQSTSGGITIQLGRYATFVGSPTPQSNQNVVNAITQQSQQQIQLQTQTNAKLDTQIQQQQTIIQQQQQQNQELSDINDNLTDETPVSDSDLSHSGNEWANANTQNGVISQLVLMPITLLNSVVSGLSNSCIPYNLGSLFGTDLILPCVNMQQLLGSVWTLIDLIISGIFIYKFGTYCVKIFNDFTNLKSGQVDTLYGGGK